MNFAERRVQGFSSARAREIDKQHHSYGLHKKTKQHMNKHQPEPVSTFRKLSNFLRPRGPVIVIFLVFILSMPVFHIYSEPERTNYRPGEAQHWLMKTNYYESSLGEYLFHTDGDFDVLIGMLERNYFSNYIGVPVLLFYYLIACSLGSMYRKAIKISKLKN
jgi:hypothetical protein